MIFVDKPYISDFLKETIKKNAFPVVQTDSAKELGFVNGVNLLDEVTAIKKVKSNESVLIYTTSENAIGWIAKNLSFTNIPEKIDLFKNKVKFRTLIKSLYPHFYFKKVKPEQLENLSLENIPLPFIIKPAVGFFSMGVYKVTSLKEWESIKKKIQAEILDAKNVYPSEVLDTSAFIIEQCVKGEEFAIDAYFNSKGEPVILNILKHIFSSDQDVSDRVYMTSKDIIETNLAPFTEFLKRIGALTQVKNFPVHVEIRQDSSGEIVPIEINPMRFGGWCTTADMTYYAYGFNPYEYYFSQRQPDWDDILKNKNGMLYSIIVLDNSTGVAENRISKFHYKKLLSRFENPLELRKINYQEYPVFGFLFTETKKENFNELERILKSDLNEFITVKNE